jgi:hypothetical protein
LTINALSPLPPGVEGPFGTASCTDTLDNDCDGFTDADDPDCAPLCTPQPEVCDGVDNDCNNIIDDVAPVPTTFGIGVCANTGAIVCQNGQLVDTCQPLPAGVEQFGVCTTCNDNSDNDCDTLVDAADHGCAAPLVEQACFDNIDDDGDGLVDCADPDCAGAVDGTYDIGFASPCAQGQVQCVNNAAACVQTVFPQPEICTGGIDDDCDSLTDAADPNCMVGDVGLIKLIVPDYVTMKVGDRDRHRLINVLARVFNFDEDVMETVALP